MPHTAHQQPGDVKRETPTPRPPRTTHPRASRPRTTPPGASPPRADRSLPASVKRETPAGGDLRRAAWWVRRASRSPSRPHRRPTRHRRRQAGRAGRPPRPPPQRPELSLRWSRPRDAEPVLGPRLYVSRSCRVLRCSWITLRSNALIASSDTDRPSPQARSRPPDRRSGQQRHRAALAVPRPRQREHDTRGSLAGVTRSGRRGAESRRSSARGGRSVPRGRPRRTRRGGRGQGPCGSSTSASMPAVLGDQLHHLSARDRRGRPAR